MSLTGSVEMVFKIFITSVPLVSRFTSFHQSQLSSLTDGLTSPFLHIGKMFTTRSTTDHKSSAVYGMERDSGSNNALVELRKFDMSHDGQKQGFDVPMELRMENVTLRPQ